jgi:transcriptional regulator with XRE-family HTH domain
MSEYERFKNASSENNRLLKTEELMLGVQEELREIAKTEHVTITEIGERVGVTRKRISQLFNDTPNWMLSTLSNVADALGYDVTISFRKRDIVPKAEDPWTQDEIRRFFLPVPGEALLAEPFPDYIQKRLDMIGKGTYPYMNTKIRRER